MERLTYETMLRAWLARDASYDGEFYVGVKTTGIYCLPSCRAKRPLARNIAFFADRSEAIAAGFRGCKRCNSETYPDVAPPWLAELLTLMKRELGDRIDEGRLVQVAGADISTIRRHFKEHFHTTPMAFHRKLRLAHAKRLIEGGVDYLTAAYECGFESPSGFRDAFVKEFGTSPGRYYAERYDRL